MRNGSGVGDVGRLEDDGVQLDAVAHGDHDFGALVVVEDVMDGLSRAAIDNVGLVGSPHAVGTPASSTVKRTVIWCQEWRRSSRSRLQFGGNDPLRFERQLAVLHIEAQRRIRLVRIGVFAGESFREQRQAAPGRSSTTNAPLPLAAARNTKPQWQRESGTRSPPMHRQSGKVQSVRGNVIHH